MKPGSSISTNLALQSLLIYSANDMAYVLAEGAAGTIDAFVREMNATAQILGMTGTHFVNPNGLFDPRQITTARDIAILATALLKTIPNGHITFRRMPSPSASANCPTAIRCCAR